MAEKTNQQIALERIQQAAESHAQALDLSELGVKQRCRQKSVNSPA